MLHPVYTMGYSGQHAEDLYRIAHQKNAVVCDIRIDPVSKMREWRGDQLQRRLGYRYIHLREWGNVNAGTDGPIELAKDAMGLVKVSNLARKSPVILLCACKEYANCHRRVCAELLRHHRDWETQQRFQVQELAWPILPAPGGFMKCLTLHQPWATLVALNAKRIETRGWPTSYRGEFLIHAGKTTEALELCLVEPFGEVLIRAGYHFDLESKTAKPLPLGCVVAVARLVDCVPTEQLIKEGRVSEQERAFGNFAPARFGWVMEDIRPLPVPFPARGYQGLFNLEIDLEAVMAQQPEAMSEQPEAEPQRKDVEAHHDAPLRNERCEFAPSSTQQGLF